MFKIKKFFLSILEFRLIPAIHMAIYEFRKRSGLVKRKYPKSYGFKAPFTLASWRKSLVRFFFQSKEDLKVYSLENKEGLKKQFQSIQKGQYNFFGSGNINVGIEYDWISNPDTRFLYDITKHWTETEITETQGDLRYLWEMSRFSFLQTIIRYDYHFKEDQSVLVFKQILGWIDADPTNYGPNYSSGKEMSLRVLNWIFALHYYRNSSNLTEEIFEKMLHAIYDHAKHVETTLKYYRSTEEEGGVLSQSVLLYTLGLLFPSFEESEKWKSAGKAIIEEQGFEEINEDGSLADGSLSRLRLCLQLYTWIFYLARINRDSFSTALVERTQRSVNFLYNIQDEVSGQLPNYGVNEGSLFFILNSCPINDYRPQLNTFFHYFNNRSLYEPGAWDEDIFWFTNKTVIEKIVIPQKNKGYETGGYYVLKDDNKFAFIRCGEASHHAHADNLHLDIWINGVNIIRDSGAYRKKGASQEDKAFAKTLSHNTIAVGEFDQMEMGPDSEWHYLSKSLEAKIESHREWTLFSGKINAFRHVNSNILHKRTVKQYKHALLWEVIDIIENTNLYARQIWNLHPDFTKLGFEITCTDEKGNIIHPVMADNFYSSIYGEKVPSRQMIFESQEKYFKTIIFKKVIPKPMSD